MNTEAQKTYLDWRDRPQNVRDEISKVFTRINLNEVSSWGLSNGKKHYEICYVNEHKLIKDLVNKNPEQNEFYILDVGAGGYQFSNGIANYINQDAEISETKAFNIIGLSGERYESRIVKQGKCTIQQYGSFQIENIIDEFNAKGFDLSNKLDLITSAYTFMHLVDPVGTFQQIYSLLRPNTGIFLLQGFQTGMSQFRNEIDKLEERLKSTVDLLQKFEAKFILCPTLPELQLAVQKSSEHEFDVPLKYTGQFINSFICNKTMFSHSSYCEEPYSKDIGILANLVPQSKCRENLCYNSNYNAQCYVDYAKDQISIRGIVGGDKTMADLLDPMGGDFYS